MSLYSPFAVIAFARVIGALAVRPLELARRTAQRAVLKRFGARLNQATFEDLARGPLVKRLGLSADDAKCTRDEFTLLTLVLVRTAALRGPACVGKRTWARARSGSSSHDRVRPLVTTLAARQGY